MFTTMSDQPKIARLTISFVSHDHEAQIVQFRILSFNINVHALQALQRND